MTTVCGFRADLPIRWEIERDRWTDDGEEGAIIGQTDQGQVRFCLSVEAMRSLWATLDVALADAERLDGAEAVS